MYRFPRPFEVGAVATMAERVFEQFLDDDVHSSLIAERFMHVLSDTFAFNPVPQAIKPIAEVAWSNTNWYTGRSIESLGMEMKNLSSTERKRAWTSETAIAASEAMGAVIPWDKVVLSPVQIEHLIRGYFGWLGATTLTSIDVLATRPLTDAPEAPDWDIRDMPVIKRFARENDPNNTKYTTFFYDRMGEIRRAYADINNAKTFKDFEKAKRLMEKNRDILGLRRFYENKQKQLSKINRRMNIIRSSRKFSGAEKQAEMRRLRVAKNKLTKMVDQKTRDRF
jgi:hypothetical protein